MGVFMCSNDKKVISNSKCWEVELDTVDSCGKAPQFIDVFIGPLAKVKIDRMMELFRNIEWLAYLVGEGNKVLDIVIPKQKVSSGSVTDIDSSVCNDGSVIGVIHSHHSMGNSFSKTDDDWINQNNDISLCISNNGINGQVRWKTPCGSLMSVKALVKTLIEVDFDVESFDKTVKENIEEKVYVYYHQGYVKKSYSDNLKKKEYEEKKYGIKDCFDTMNDNDRTLEDELKFLEEFGLADDKLE
jgi:hypothetical protein